MKKLTSLTLLLALCLTGICQSPYFDALKLKNRLNANAWPDGDPAVEAILSQYTTNSIKDEFKEKNPYTKKYMRGWSSSGGATGAILASMGGMDITTLADGLGKFLAERTKEEINMAFFDKFRLLLSEHPELGTAFPATVKYLNVIMNHEYANLLPTLKEAFERDLKTLPKNLLNLAALKPEDCHCTGERQRKCEQRVALIRNLFQTEEGTLVTASLVVTDAILGHTSGPEIFSAVTANDLIKNNNNNASNLLRLIGIVSNSVRDSAQIDQWITAGQVKAMAKDTNWFRIYVGLIYQQVKNERIVFGKENAKDTLWKRMNDVEPTITGFGNYIYPVVFHGEAMTNDIKSWKTKDSVSATDVNVFIGHFRQFFKAATQYSTINPKLIKEPSDNAKLAFYVTDQGLEITQNILVKNYSAAVVSCLFLVDSLMTTQQYATRKGAIVIDQKSVAADKEQVSQIKTDLLLEAKTPDDIQKALQYERSSLKKKEQTAFDKLLPTKTDSLYKAYRAKYVNPDSTLKESTIRDYITQNYLTKMAFKRNFVRYGSFMANVILAKNSDEVKKAIQSVALPPGSSSIKKTTNFTITLQAYTGFSGGREVSGFDVAASEGTFFNALSIYAPVGIAFNIGLKSHRNPSNKYNAGSLSAMISIIDVGAIFSYRFSYPDDTLANGVRIRLENIFAPGVNLVYGIPKVPLSIGTGLQWQPSLTRISSTKTTIVNQPGVRWQFFLVFDLPMLNLYTSKR